MISSLRHAQIRAIPAVDVLVVGAGSAGCCAAIAAARMGKNKVLLVERYGFPGGTSTQVLTTFYGFFTPGPEPRMVVGGLPAEVVDRLAVRRAMYLRPNTYGAGTGVTYNPETLKLVWDEMLAEAGVECLLHSSLVDVETQSDGSPVAGIFWNKGGFFKVPARRFIDASGDADFCALAGLPYEKAGEIDPAQTLTTTFRMANADWAAFERAGGKKMLMRKMAEAVESGSHPLPRKAGSAHAMVQRGCVSTVAVRVADVDATDAWQLSEAEREGRRQAFAYEAFFRDCVPGFEASDIIGLSHQIGVRETRRVEGEYRLTRADIERVARFDDCVLLCGAPIEDHRPAKDGGEETDWFYVPEHKAYDVPYRTLVPRGSDTVWVVGRCFSATHDAHASCRSMGQTMAMGQAAGTAAAISLETDEAARNFDTATLREKLAATGAVLTMSEHPSKIGPADWPLNRK
jgi:hypothetical protein